MASGVVSFMGVTGTLNAYPTYIIAYLPLIYCLSPDNFYAGKIPIIFSAL
jgi:hypothetical protein